ncbi:MAG: metallophosphoesterase, partial [Clostridiales bacterium]|nr:metallophosphoesterase [Clostridiales bacterium]
LQISDIQESFILLPITKDNIVAAVEKTQPDLILLTGDNFGGRSTCNTKIHPLDKQLAKRAIKNYMSYFEKKGIPTAAVFGNHDDQGTVTKEEQIELFSEYKCFIGYDEGDSVYGVGNYNIPIYSSKDKSKIAYNIWMIDSNSYEMLPDGSDNGYDYVHQDQIDWYINKSNELKAQNGGKLVPSLMFQHIVVPDVYNYLKEVDSSTPGAVSRGDKYYILDPRNTRAGVMHESPSCSKTNSGQFDAVVRQGDVKAMIFGHDHVNSYEIVTGTGVDLINTPAATFASYGDETRGVREIVLDESDLETYDTSVITYFDLFGDGEVSTLRFKAFVKGTPFGERIASLFKYIFLKYFLGIFGYTK